MIPLPGGMQLVCAGFVKAFGYLMGSQAIDALIWHAECKMSFLYEFNAIRRLVCLPEKVSAGIE